MGASYTPGAGESEVLFSAITASEIPDRRRTLSAFGRTINLRHFAGDAVRRRTGFTVHGAYDRQTDTIWMSSALESDVEYAKVLAHELLHAAPFARPLTHTEIDSLIEGS